MKTFLFFKVVIGFLMLLIVNPAAAQFTFSPSTTLLKNQALNLMTYDSIHISNTGSDTLKLNWELIAYDTTGGSYFDFCASGQCYLGIPDTGSFPDIPPGQFGYIGAHFWTGNVTAACTTRVRVYDEANPSVSDTIMFVLNATASGIQNYDLMNSIEVFPNPTTEVVNIRSTGVNGTSAASTPQLLTITVYNSCGEQVLYSVSNTVSLKGLETGRYFMVVTDKTGHIFPRTIQKVN